jgi:hypothetical protein
MVIPAKAGIQLFQDVLDPGFRRGDASRDFLRDHQERIEVNSPSEFRDEERTRNLLPYRYPP